MEKHGVVDAQIFDNTTSATVTRQGIDITGHSIMAVTEGGVAADIAEALKESKPLGIGMVGTSTHVIDGTTYRWNLCQKVELVITLQIRVRSGFPSDGVGQIKDNIVKWSKGEFDPGDGFDTTGLAIGENISLERLRTPINAIHGHDIVSLTVQKKNAQGNPVALTDVTLIQRQTIEAANINVSITQ